MVSPKAMIQCMRFAHTIILHFEFCIQHFILGKDDPMSDAQKKQNFLQGTALLAMATAIVKIIGAFYKIPLNAIIGEKGLAAGGDHFHSSTCVSPVAVL